MKLRKFSLLAGLFMLATSAVKAQNPTYNRAVGLRIGGGFYDNITASYKEFLNNNGAGEINAGFGGRYGSTYLSLSAAYQHHFDIEEVAGLKWFVGGGATVFNGFGSNGRSTKGFGLGIFPTAGLDYKFTDAPVNVTLDFRPTFLAVRPGYYNTFRGDNFSLSFRYVLD